LFAEENALHPLRNASDNLIRNGFECLGHLDYGRIVAKNYHRITFTGGAFGGIDHQHIHANTADNRRFLSAYGDVARSVAPMAVDSVGVTNRDGGDRSRSLR